MDYNKPRLFKELKTGHYYWIVSRHLVHYDNTDTFVAFTKVNRYVEDEDLIMNDMVWILPKSEFQSRFKPIRLREND